MGRPDIFLELFLIAAVLWVLATGTMGVHRFQISVLLAIATVFAIIATDGSIYGNFLNSRTASHAMGAGWLLLSIVNVRAMSPLQR
jgi:SHO1 osmosensor